MKAKRAKELKDKQDIALAELVKKADDAKKIKDDADAELAKLQAEIAKNTPPDA